MRTVRFGIVCAAVAMLSTTAFAGTWNNSSGAAQDFSWANGGDLNGLFTDSSGNGPVSQSGNDLFFNLDFNVSANDPLQTDTMSLDVHANEGLMFSEIRFVFAGFASWAPSTTVDADGTLVIEDLNSGAIWDENTVPPPTISPFSSNPFSFPFTSTAGGTSPWNATIQATLEFTLEPATDLHLDLSHWLEMTGLGGNINTQQGAFEIEFTLVPEPASLVLLAVGSLALLRRRR